MLLGGLCCTVGVDLPDKCEAKVGQYLPMRSFFCCYT